MAERLDRPRKDIRFESVLATMNSAIADVDARLDLKSPEPSLPIVFVIGAQRSGTTILTQTLARLYRFSYPTNLIARFWRAPHVGEALSRSLGLDEGPSSFESKFGATADINGPHEFSYFWSHWFPGSAIDARPHKPPDASEAKLKRQLAAWQSIAHEPLLFKNLLEVIPNISILAELFPTAFFLNIEREDLFVIQSTYESRVGYGGAHDAWFGVKPSNFVKIQANSDQLLQVIDQVFWVKRDISAALRRLDTERSMTITYEDLVVSSPIKPIAAIERAFRLSPFRREGQEVADIDLRGGNRLRLPRDKVEVLTDRLGALARMHGGEDG